MSGLKVRSQKYHSPVDITVIKLGGCIDLFTADEVDRAVAAAVRSHCHRIIADMSDVDYVSSKGWTVFLNWLKQMHEHGGDLCLARMKPDLLQVYNVLEFNWLLKHFNEIDEAVVYLLSPAAPAHIRTDPYLY